MAYVVGMQHLQIDSKLARAALTVPAMQRRLVPTHCHDILQMYLSEHIFQTHVSLQHEHIHTCSHPSRSAAASAAWLGGARLWGTWMEAGAPSGCATQGDLR